MIDAKNLNVKLIEQVEFNPEKDIEKEIIDFIPSIKKETITLDNGAEGHFVYSGSP